MATRAMRVPVAGGFILAVVLLALALIFSGKVGGSPAGPGPDVAVAGCGGIRADVQAVSKFPRPFASQYQKKLRIQVLNRTGNVKRWHLELYTFSGFYLGKSKEKSWLEWGDKAAIKLRQGLQPGPYTVVVKGEVLGCGESETSGTVKLKNCLNKLPIHFFNKPQGLASDYNRGGYVSIGVEPKSAWAPIKQLHSTLSDSDGVVYGEAELPKGQRKLIGQAYLNNKLKRELKPGDYSVYVTGKAPQPRECGDKSKTAVLEFK